jgi:hypothetical protein
MYRSDLNIAVASVVVVMTIFSWALVIQGAEDEPYDYFRRSDAIAQIIGGTALISCWFCLSLAVVVLVSVRRLSRRWLIVLLWAAICMLYLKDCPLGYLYDVEHFILPHAGGATGR